MTRKDVFNGDADGICSLIQLRLVEPVQGELITGVKRDVRLLREVAARHGDLVTVLDLSFDRNREDVQRLLAVGARVRYFDHHFSGEIPNHPGLEATIDTSPGTCTSLLVNRCLGGCHAAWAIVGAFGDNLFETAAALARESGFTHDDSARLRKLGELLNYNSYGTRLDELYCHPAVLFRRLVRYADPRSVLAECDELAGLARGFEADLAAARGVTAELSTDRAAAYALPDAPWARRVVGTWANELSRAFPAKAHLLLCPDGEGTLTVSVRAARLHPRSAAAFCRRYRDGGGREAAAGISRFDPARRDELVGAFTAAFD